jgi:RNA polymerase sigma-70 factor (ECF subfamily)
VNSMQSDNRGTISSTLLESVKARRPEAWRRLVDLYGQVVYRWCRKSGLGAEDAADAVQEVFSAVSRHVADFHRNKSNGSFTAWLSSITHSKVCDHFRRRYNQAQAQGGTKALEQMQEIPDPKGGQSPFPLREKGDSPRDAAVPGEKKATVPSEKKVTAPGEFDLIEAEKIISRRAMELVRAEFEPRTWEAWWKTAVEGRPAADVAADLGMSVTAVYKAKSRVLLRLRQELAGLQG